MANNIGSVKLEVRYESNNKGFYANALAYRYKTHI